MPEVKITKSGLRDLLVKEIEVLRTQAWATMDGQAAFQYMNRCQGFFKNHSMALINLLKEIEYEKPKFDKGSPDDLAAGGNDAGKDGDAGRAGGQHITGGSGGQVDEQASEQTSHCGLDSGLATGGDGASKDRGGPKRLGKSRRAIPQETGKEISHD